MSWLQLARAVFRRDLLAEDYEEPPAYGPADLSHAKLTDRQELVIRLRFGLEPQTLTLEQVGRMLGVTRERVRLIEAQALEKMRKAASEREEGGGDEGDPMVGSTCSLCSGGCIRSPHGMGGDLSPLRTLAA